MKAHHTAVVALVRRALPSVLAIAVAAEVGAQEGVLGTGGIRGQVRDSTGQAIIGAQVTMPGTSLIAESDDSGRFELAKVRPGMLSMRVRRLGFQPDTVDILVLAGKAADYGPQ